MGERVTGLGAGTRAPPENGHDEHDRCELQHHAKPHELLRFLRWPALHHVDEAEKQNAGDGDDRKENEKARS
jgi:hypothetical protein